METDDIHKKNDKHIIYKFILKNKKEMGIKEYPNYIS